MRSLGFAEVPIEKISAGLDARLSLPRIQSLAVSFEELGDFVHKPVVRQSDWRLIVGRDRVASQIILERETVLCELVECTDLEAEQMEDIENACRRHDPNEQALATERILARYTAQARANGFGGAHKSPKGLARDRLARELGVKPHTIRQREWRAKKRREQIEKFKETPPEPKVKESTEPPPPINVMGLDVTREYLDDVEVVKRHLSQASVRLHQALALLTNLTNEGPNLKEVCLYEPRITRLYNELKIVSQRLQNMVPASLCLYCKCLDGPREICKACMGQGFGTPEDMRDAPEELLREGEDAMVSSQGKTVPIYDVVPIVDEVALEDAPREDEWAPEGGNIDPPQEDPLGGEW